MSVYRDDLDAAVRRASALEADLCRLKNQRREDKAELRVKVAELSEDLARERKRLAQLEEAVST